MPADPGFQVVIDSTEHTTAEDGGEEGDQLAGLDEFLESATATISGALSASGEGIWRISSNVLDLADEQVTSSHFPNVGTVHFRIAYFVYRSDAIGDIKVRIAQEMGSRYGGVRLYRDRLRVMPYGEPDNDWLGLNLEYRRRNVLVPIATNNVFGVVEVTRQDNPGLVDTASREGIVEGPALDELREFIREGVIWGALRVASVRNRKQRTTSRPLRAISRTDLVSEVQAELGKKIALLPSIEVSQVQSLVDTTLEHARDRAADSDAVEQELLSELALLRVLASLGSTIAVFSHEVTGILTRSDAAINDAADSLRAGVSAEEHLKILRAQLGQLRDLSMYITNYVSASSRRNRSPLAVKKVLDDFENAFASFLRQRSIVMEVETSPRNLRTAEMASSEMEAILFNLLSNAIKAIDREGQTDRRIRVSATRIDDSVLVRFEDNGCGIDPTVRDRIFDAFFTTTEGAPSELGAGTGLGLKVVRDIVISYRGTVDLGTPSAGFATAIEIRLPQLTRGKD